jgi:hypothetical protein
VTARATALHLPRPAELPRPAGPPLQPGEVLDAWESTLFHCGAVRRLLEDLGSALYPPQDEEELRGSGGALLTCLELMVDECPEVGAGGRGGGWRGGGMEGKGGGGCCMLLLPAAGLLQNDAGLAGSGGGLKVQRGRRKGVCCSTVLLDAGAGAAPAEGSRRLPPRC